MGKRVCENVDSKREFLYSFSTLVFIPFLYYFAVTSAFNPESVPVVPASSSSSESSDHGGESVTRKEEEEKVFVNVSEDERDSVVYFIVQKRELPWESVVYVVVFEVLKLLLVFTIFPESHLFDQTPSQNGLWPGFPGFGGGGGAGLGKGAQGRLPFSRRDRDNGTVKAPTLQTKVVEIWNGVCNYFAGVFVCHLLVVLFGAPIIQDFKVTFQFSVILTTWLLAPMCLAVQPSRLLEELMFISLWSSDNEVLFRTKWRFAITAVGAWVGAVVIPLDWDRPWQKWPIPVLSSTTFIFFISNLVFAIHLFCTIFGVYHRIYLCTTESNKIKNF